MARPTDCYIVWFTTAQDSHSGTVQDPQEHGHGRYNALACGSPRVEDENALTQDELEEKQKFEQCEFVLASSHDMLTD